MNPEGMQGQVSDLTERLKTKAGLTDEQVAKVMETVREFVGEKFPMMQGMVDNLLGGSK